MQIWQTFRDFVMIVVHEWPWLVKVKRVDQSSRLTVVFSLSHATEGKGQEVIPMPTTRGAVKVAKWA